MKQLMDEYIKTSAQWLRFLKTDAYGKPTYSPPIDIKIRWEEKLTKVINNQTGAEVVTNFRLWLNVNGFPSSVTGDRIKHNNKLYKIISFEVLYDFDGKPIGKVFYVGESAT